MRYHRLEYILLFLFLFVHRLRGSSLFFSQETGRSDLQTCASNCLFTGGSDGMDTITGCFTAKCLCDPHEFSIALFVVAKCISSQPEEKVNPTGCGEDSQQAAAAETVLKKACSISGYVVDNVEKATALPEGTPTKTNAAEGTATVTTVIRGAGSAAAKIEHEYLGMFVVIIFGAMAVTIAIPALMFRNAL